MPVCNFNGNKLPHKDSLHTQPITDYVFGNKKPCSASV